MYIRQTSNSFDVVDNGNVIKEFPMKQYEYYNDSLAKLSALDYMKKALNLPFIDYQQVIKKEK